MTTRDDATEAVDAGARAAETLNTRVRELESSFQGLLGAGTRSAEQVSRTATAFDKLAEATSGPMKAIADISAYTADLAGKLPGIGPALQGMGDAFSVAADLSGKLVTGLNEVQKRAFEAFDGPSREIRKFDLEMQNLGRRFGGTIQEARKFGDTLKEETASGFARGLHMTAREMADFVKEAGQTSLSMEQLNESVTTALGATKLYAVAAASASAMGITAAAAATLLNTAMNKQGKSAQEASKMLGMFHGTAREVGLRASTVAETLNGAVQGFEKLGISADFGRPILEGFGRVMNDMGLGIENAIGVTQSLSKALAGLTNDYANAYIMFQRGGIEMPGGGGGGGVLGASIGMQAAMLDAEKTGDQAAIGNMMVTGLRNTLESFTGGDIVTVQQAAESPELQNQFYVQQQMLMSQFGVADQGDATRVLDLLSQLDDATRAGDTDAAASAQENLNKMLQNEEETRDGTLDELEKANRFLEVQINLLSVIARPTLMTGRAMARIGREQLVDPAIAWGGRQAQRGAEWANRQSAAAARRFGLDPESDAGREAGRLLSAQGTGNALPALHSAASGRGTPEETRQATEAVNSQLRGGGVAENIERIIALTSANTTDSRMREAGFTNREDLAIALGNAIKESYSQINVNIELAPGVGGILEASAALAQEAANLSGGIGSSTPPSG